MVGPGIEHGISSSSDRHAIDCCQQGTDITYDLSYCRSENLTALKIHFDNCKTVVHAASGLVMLPVYTDDNKIISFMDAFNDTTPTCPANGTGVGAFGGGSGLSGWSASGSGRLLGVADIPNGTQG